MYGFDGIVGSYWKFIFPDIGCDAEAAVPVFNIRQFGLDIRRIHIYPPT